MHAHPTPTRMGMRAGQAQPSDLNPRLAMQVVDGNRLVATPYDLSFKKPVQNVVLCKQKLSARHLDIFRRVRP